jgi:hypothetical protein
MSPDDIAFAARNAHITDAELAEDLADTEAEIARMTQEAEAWEKLPRLPEHRWDHMKADARREGVKERAAFCEKLRRIQRIRAEQALQQ